MEDEPTVLDDSTRAWVEDRLGRRLVRAEPLTGGLTSTMLALDDDEGGEWVLRLMTNEPWRTHGRELVLREAGALRALAGSTLPTASSHATDADGTATEVAAHLTSRLPGARVTEEAGIDPAAMADLLVAIHEVVPSQPFRDFQSWAWEAKWVVPPWTRHPDSWRTAFELLAAGDPDHGATFLHRDFSHRNLLVDDSGTISGVVDWVETSSGPAWLDAAHAATNLVVAFGEDVAEDFLGAFAARSPHPFQQHWLVMDAVGFLPPPGRRSMFDHPEQLRRLDGWLHRLVTSDARALF